MAKQSTTLQDIIESEGKKKVYRDEYNKRPEVVERRRLYNTLRLDEAKVARKVVNGSLTLKEGEAKIESLRKTYNDALAKLDGKPSANRAQASTNGGS